ncbi:MAG: filamentous hemagglutinin N-terminal domain-containing protein [Verrucomicrobiota bacterium]
MKNNSLQLLSLLLGVPTLAWANPQGLTVQSGTATAATSGNQLTITASHNAFLNWQSFNIGAGQTTSFIQPSATSVVWNRINDASPSQIYGNLTANGVVVLMNQNGFYFGPNSFVSAAGLVVSTAPIGPIDSSAGLFWQFTGPSPSVSIINYGQLNVGKGGSAFLIAERIENHGTISAPEGNIGLLAGQEVLLSERPDGRGLSATVKLPTGSVNNSGDLIADAGTIALQAQVVNQGGLVQANSIRERNGIIELFASDAITLSDSSVISTSGDATSASAGGEIVIKSDGTFADSAASQINVTGGGLGGDGGFVEVSAPYMSAVNSRIDGSSFGGVGGRLLIDPLNITIGNTGSGSAGSGTVGSGDAPAAGTLSLNVNSAFVGFSQITLQALNNITISSGTLWDLAASTGISSPGSLLKLEAGNNITVGSGASIVGGDGWSVTLQAGRNFSLAGTVVSGVGTISFSGTASLQTTDGNISLLAGNNITVASGHVRTIGGGSINAHAVGGSINTGTKANGYQFLPTGYQVSADLGGISTANGGDVTLTAGLDVTSYLPIAGGGQTDAGSGAFGAAPGNVTVTAGRDVSGHYVVRNGTGSITAGRNAGTTTRLLALSLVTGGWNVSAAQDILLQEVRNPNGVFNNLGSSSSPYRYLFDYAPDAYTVLNAGNSVQLLGTALPRYTDAFSRNMPAIYPGTLEITAGAGGVILGNDVILFPSPLGNLEITTTDSGSLVGTKVGGLAQLILSDSGKTQYKVAGDFGIADHASVPIHLNDSEPLKLDISGDLESVLIGSAKAAEINVGGDLINSRFDGQNLHDSDVTTINVAGDIINRNIFTTVISDTAPNFTLFDPLLNLVYPPLAGTAAGVQNQFFYNATTKELTFQGRMTGDQLQALLTLRVRSFDANGNAIVDENGEPVTVSATFINATVLQQLYAASQDVPTDPDTGYRLGGGGQFNITANNMDLGATVGVVSQGPRANAALANYFTEGADINITLGGDLDMFSTKIASLNGGDITIYADGEINAGSRTFASSDSVARGIFTSGNSDVTVIARGDINVNGSRIAAYDGGNVLVRSLEGDVDAGTGGGGAATVEKIYVDPITRAIRTYAPTIPGSGILATTFPPSLDPAFPTSQATVGDILVETPQGNIIASSGGIVQIPLNGIGSSLGTVTLRAGTKDADGNVIYVGNIDASGSGVIGSTVKLEASGDIKGLVFARGNLDIEANQNVSVTALAGGNAAVSAGETISGTIVGVGSVSASGATVDAALLSQNVSASGDVSAAQQGFAQGNAAASASQSLANDDKAKEAAAEKKNDEDELAKKRQPGPRLAKTTGRVTVILPTKS